MHQLYLIPLIEHRIYMYVCVCARAR